MIKLTAPTGEPVWLNPAHIVSVNHEKGTSNSVIVLLGDADGWWTVKETPEEVVAMIEEKPNA